MVHCQIIIYDFVLRILSAIVMGQGQFFVARVRSGQFFVARVSHLCFGVGFRKFPLKMSNFSIFSLGVKKISSGRVKKYPDQRRVGLLFTAGQK